MEDCLFCKIVRGEIPCQKVYEDADVLAFNDIQPQAPVHVLIIPKRHIDTLSSLTDGDCLLAGRLLVVARTIAEEKGVDMTGYRLVGNCRNDAGQLVLHIHLHLLGGRVFAWPPG